MIERAIGWMLALCVLLPSVAEGQDPMLMAEGAQVFATNCNRCHNARSATERTDAQWRPIVQHMRARANLTGRQAEAVLVFLRATNIPEGQATSASTASPTGLGEVVASPAPRAESVAAPRRPAPGPGPEDRR